MVASMSLRRMLPVKFYAARPQAVHPRKAGGRIRAAARLEMFLHALEGH